MIRPAVTNAITIINYYYYYYRYYIYSCVWRCCSTSFPFQHRSDVINPRCSDECLFSCLFWDSFLRDPLPPHPPLVLIFPFLIIIHWGGVRSPAWEPLFAFLINMTRIKASWDHESIDCQRLITTSMCVSKAKSTGVKEWVVNEWLNKWMNEWIEWTSERWSYVW